MVSRALSLAAVTLLIGFFAAPCAWAQAQNLEAGKSPSQLFAGTCNACHKSPRGLLRTVSPGSLPGFLREHYTTSGDMAWQLSAFLISNGAGEGRRQSKPDADSKPAGGSDQVDRQGRKLRRAGSQEGSRPEVDSSPQAGRNGQGPAQAATERGPDGRRLSKGRPASEEIPAAKDDQPKFEPAMDDKAGGETDKREDGKAEEPKPSAEGKAEAARVDMPKEGNSSETPALRADPSPAAPAQPAASSPPPTPTSVGSIEPAAAQPPIPALAPAPSEKSAAGKASEPAAPLQSAPPSAPPVAAAGSPAPPISQ
jgi:hypothetical protein